MANETLIDKTAATSLDAGDIIYAVKDPSGTPLDRKITIQEVLDSGLDVIAGDLTSNGVDITPEQGAFTPTFTFANAGDLSVVYNATAVGSYTDIAGVVTFSAFIDFTPTFTTSTGRARIEGMPFSADTGTYTFGLTGNEGSNVPNFDTSNTQLVLRIFSSTNYIEFGGMNSGGTHNLLEAGQFTSGTRYIFRISGTYKRA